MRQDGSKEHHDWAEGQSEGCVSWSSRPPWEEARMLQSRYHRRWVMDFRVGPRDKTKKSGVTHCKLSPPKKARMSKSKIKSMLICFFWQSGDRPQGICATRTNCQSNLLSRSPWKTQEKSGTCATRHCTHMDVAPRQRPMSHGSLHQWTFGRKKHSCGFSAPYSPDLSPCDFFLFSRLKNHLKGRHFVLWIIYRRA